MRSQQSYHPPFITSSNNSSHQLEVKSEQQGRVEQNRDQEFTPTNITNTTQNTTTDHSLKNEIQTLKNRIKQLEADKSNCQNVLMGKENELSDLRIDFESQNKKIEMLKSELKQKRLDVMNLQNELLDLTPVDSSSRHDDDTKCKELEGKCAELEVQLQKVTVERDQSFVWKNKFDDSQTEMSVLRGQLIAVKEELERAHQQVLVHQQKAFSSKVSVRSSEGDRNIHVIDLSCDTTTGQQLDDSTSMEISTTVDEESPSEKQQTGVAQNEKVGTKSIFISVPDKVNSVRNKVEQDDIKTNELSALAEKLRVPVFQIHKSGDANKDTKNCACVCFPSYDHQVDEMLVRSLVENKVILKEIQNIFGFMLQVIPNSGRMLIFSHKEEMSAKEFTKVTIIVSDLIEHLLQKKVYETSKVETIVKSRISGINLRILDLLDIDNVDKFYGLISFYSKVSEAHTAANNILRRYDSQRENLLKELKCHIGKNPNFMIVACENLYHTCAVVESFVEQIDILRHKGDKYIFNSKENFKCIFDNLIGVFQRCYDGSTVVSKMGVASDDDSESKMLLQIMRTISMPLIKICTQDEIKVAHILFPGDMKNVQIIQKVFHSEAVKKAFKCTITLNSLFRRIEVSHASEPYFLLCVSYIGDLLHYLSRVPSTSEWKEVLDYRIAHRLEEFKSISSSFPKLLKIPKDHKFSTVVSFRGKKSTAEKAILRFRGAENKNIDTFSEMLSCNIMAGIGNFLVISHKNLFPLLAASDCLATFVDLCTTNSEQNLNVSRSDPLILDFLVRFRSMLGDKDIECFIKLDPMTKSLDLEKSSVASSTRAMGPPSPRQIPPLPPGWEFVNDPVSGRVYYANRVTGASSWIPPMFPLPPSPENNSRKSAHSVIGASCIPRSRSNARSPSRTRNMTRSRSRTRSPSGARNMMRSRSRARSPSRARNMSRSRSRARSPSRARNMTRSRSRERIGKARFSR